MGLRQRINGFFTRHEIGWEVFMISLAVVFVVLAFLPDCFRLSSRALRTLDIIDWTITGVFVLEFTVRLAAARPPLGYLKEHWLDLVAIIPAVRWLRIARVARLIRILRFARLGRVLDSLDTFGVDLALFARLNGLQWFLLALTGLMLLLSGLFYFAESPVNAAVESYWDALYTALVTWSSAGYGDIFPVTPLGRVYGVALIMTGLVTWGVLVGNLSAFLTLLSTEKTPRESPTPIVSELKMKLTRLDRLSRDDLIALRGAVNALVEERLRRPDKPGGSPDETDGTAG